MITDEKVQGGVWSVELGRGKRVILWVLMGLLAVALSLVYTANQFRGLEKREAMDMAQLARNISEGRGFTTYVIRPLSLWHLQTHTASRDPRLVNHPDLINPPLYPLVLAGLFRLLPAKVMEYKANEWVYLPERWVILPFNQICLLLSVLLVYLWAKRLFDQRVALTAGWLLLLSDTLWSYSVSGLPTNFLILLLLVALWLLHRADERLNPFLPKDSPAASARPAMTWRVAVLVLGSAVVMGLCFLTSYRTAFLLVPVVVYLGLILRGRRPLVWVGLYLLVFGAVIAPWLARNFAESNALLGVTSYDIHQGMGNFFADVLPRSYRPEFHFSAWSLGGKFVTGTRLHLLTTFKETSSDFLVFFFVVGLLYGFRRRTLMRLRGLLLGCLAAAVVALAVVGLHETGSGSRVDGGDLLVIFLPLMAIFGAAFFYLLLDRIQFRMRLTQGLAIGAFALINVLPMIYTMLPPRRGTFPYPPYLPPYTRMVANYFGATEIGCSDLPWAMAWNGNRRTVWLPMTLEEFYEIHDVLPPKDYTLSFMMLTPYMMDQKFQSGLLKGEYKDWTFVVRGQLPALFPLKAITLVPPESDQLLLADRPRWLQSGASTLPPPSTPVAAATNAPPPATNQPSTSSRSE
jgi:4-amino-4-deoxy-L-arabinose transferase-like glycosyltransferase